jgi:hypothetical protein
MSGHGVQSPSPKVAAGSTSLNLLASLEWDNTFPDNGRL